MNRIPSVFERNEGRQCVDKVRPECQWVLDGHGFATEKFDGVACNLRGNRLYRRFRVRASEEAPPGWVHHSDDSRQRTGHGWLPMNDSVLDEDHQEAHQWLREQHWSTRHAGTYELVGPRARRNPYNLKGHQLWRHGGTVISGVTRAPRTFAGIKRLLEFELYPMEGIVFWNERPSGIYEMAKVKRKDFGLSWPDRNARIKHPQEEF